MKSQGAQSTSTAGAEHRDGEKAGIESAEFCLSLLRADRRITRNADNALRQTGLTAQQFFLLSTIAELGSPPLSEVARALGLDHSTVAANLKPLIRQNLILNSIDDNDRRVRRVEITIAGQDRVRSGRVPLVSLENQLSAKIGDEGLIRALGRMLDDLFRACDERV